MKGESVSLADRHSVSRGVVRPRLCSVGLVRDVRVVSVCEMIVFVAVDRRLLCCAMLCGIQEERGGR